MCLSLRLSAAILVAIGLLSGPLAADDPILPLLSVEDYDESRPQLVPGSDHVLEQGMVIVTEPGIYEEGLGGFRWEDNAVVTADGAVRLVKTDYGLD